ncbi:MAG: Hsp20/alpha crystallin family protein [Lewinellaceae bacterium]|nr:Hsp20/alpha crystallin family protein [Lewinellaceae bacterium]
MALIKWNPESKFFPAAVDWMDDVIDKAYADDFFPKFKGISLPAVNVSETNTLYKMEVAAPGFEKNDFKIEVKNGYLTISAETKEEKTEQDEKMNRREFFFNTFTRSFALPENVNAAKITAKFEKGMLRIALPKAKSAKEEPIQKIDIS